MDIEEKRARLTREEGRQLLMSAKITQDLGLHDVNTLQRQGSLAEMLNQEDAHIVVLGRRGEQSELTGHIGSQLEDHPSSKIQYLSVSEISPRRKDYDCV